MAAGMRLEKKDIKTFAWCFTESSLRTQGTLREAIASNAAQFSHERLPRVHKWKAGPKIVLNAPWRKRAFAHSLAIDQSRKILKRLVIKASIWAS
jgi:hypothetical protein